MFFDPDISQIEAIDVINDYLKWHNLPLEWNREGVCHGLATVHAQYVLQGKEQEFFALLNQIVSLRRKDFAGLSKSTVPTQDINYFLTQVIMAFSPGRMDKNYRQLNSYEVLNINGESLTSNFSLSLVTHRKNWESIFKNLELSEGEIFRLSSPEHTVSLSKTAKGYVIYDPNYPKGKKSFKNEQKLVNELKNNVFHFNNDVMALEIRDISLESKPAKYRDVGGICRPFIKEAKEANLKCKYSSGRVSNLEWMAFNNNVEAFSETLFNPDVKVDNDEREDIIENAIANDSVDVLSLMIPKCMVDIHESTEDERESFKALRELVSQAVSYSLRFGSKGCYQFLMTDPKYGKMFAQLYSSHLRQPNSPNVAIYYAALGGNADILPQLLETIRFLKTTEGDLMVDSLAAVIKTGAQSVDKRGNKSILSAAIEGGSSECLELLLTELKSGEVKLEEDEFKSLLRQAIEKNNRFMVSHLIEFMATQDEAMVQQVVSSVTLTVSQARRADLSILRQLKNYNAEFSPIVQSVIADREQHNMAMLEYAGVQFVSFLEFLLLTVGAKQHVDFRMFKAQVLDQKAGRPVVESDEQSDSIEVDEGTDPSGSTPAA